MPLFYKYTYHGEAVNGDQSTNMTLKSPVSKNAKNEIRETVLYSHTFTENISNHVIFLFRFIYFLFVK